MKALRNQIIGGNKAKAYEDQKNNKRAINEKRWAFLRRTPFFLNFFDSASILKRIEPYIKNGQEVADIGSGKGYFTFILADMVGAKGKVFSIELSENCIRMIQKKAEKGRYHNIEAYAANASNLKFLKDRSVDFIFAKGLLCTMKGDRGLAVREMKRILKPKAKAYISLGAPPPLGLVNEEEWMRILKEFKVLEGGSYQEMWVIVSLN